VLGLRGTPAHVGVSGKSDNAVYREIGAKMVDGKWSSYHLKPVISGVQFDLAHHGPSFGKKIHTFGNSARAFARNVFLLALSRRDPLPQVIMRVHVHKCIHETPRDFGHEYHMFITPAFQWAVDYKHKIDTEDDLGDVGGVVVTVEACKVLEMKLARSRAAKPRAAGETSEISIHQSRGAPRISNAFVWCLGGYTITGPKVLVG